MGGARIRGLCAKHYALYQRTGYAGERRKDAGPMPEAAVYSVSGADIPMPGDWRLAARCRTVPLSVFFPVHHGGPGRRATSVFEPARQVCAPCPVREQCLDYALQFAALEGVWGGTTKSERDELRGLEAAPTETPAPRAESTTSTPGALYSMLVALTQHPGRWARVASYSSKQSAAATAASLRCGIKRAPAGRWQFEGRMNDTGGSDLYALYEGDVDTEADYASAGVST